MTPQKFICSRCDTGMAFGRRHAAAPFMRHDFDVDMGLLALMVFGAYLHATGFSRTHSRAHSLSYFTIILICR